jgi:hypothetical protein
MNQPAEDALIAKIRELPAERIAQVEDFVNFLAAQERRRTALARLQALRIPIITPAAALSNIEQRQSR